MNERDETYNPDDDDETDPPAKDVEKLLSNWEADLLHQLYNYSLSEVGDPKGFLNAVMNYVDSQAIRLQAMDITKDKKLEVVRRVESKLKENLFWRQGVLGESYYSAILIPFKHRIR